MSNAKTLDRSTIGNWLTYEVKTDLTWVVQDTPVYFRGWKIWLLPEEENRPPTIAIDKNQKVAEGAYDLQKGDARTLLSNLLSAICWMNPCKISLGMGVGGPRLGGIGKMNKSKPVRSMFSGPFTAADNIPITDTDVEILALALHREGCELDSVPYKFLNFYRIINAVCGGPKEQVAWINKEIDNLGNNQLQSRIDEIKAKHKDVGNYLYGQGRCAVSHADLNSNAVVNPDNMEDYWRLQEDLPIIICLARKAIEDKLGIKTPQTQYREHLYELEGFAALYGASVVERIKAGESVPLTEIPHIGTVTIGQKGKEPYRVFEALTPVVTAVKNGVVHLVCVSEDETVKVKLYLNFKEERLQSDFVNGVFVGGAEKTASGIRKAAEALKFQFDYFGTGMLVVTLHQPDLDIPYTLGFCEPFIPVNMMPNPDGIKAKLEEMEAEAKKLEEAGKP